MVRIALTAGAINGNRGSEAMLVTTIGRIRELLPEAQFGIFTPYYRDDLRIWRKTPGVVLLNSSPLYLALVLVPAAIIAGIGKKGKLTAVKNYLPAPVAFLWDCNAVIDFAGVSFMDSRPHFLPFNILSMYPGFLLGIPVVKFSQAVGPFNNPVNAWCAKHCFNRCAHIYARGEKTRSYLDTLPLKTKNYSVAPDIAFCHEDGDRITSENEELLREFLTRIDERKKNGATVIGIGPSSVIASGSGGGNRYVDFIVDLARTLADAGRFCVFFPNSSKEHKPRVWRNNDLPLLRRIRSRCRGDEERFLFCDANFNASSVKHIIGRCDATVTSRFHAMIFSLSLRIPVFVVGWSHKYREVMSDFAMEKYVVDYRSADAATVSAGVNDLLANREPLRREIGGRFAEVRKKSYVQIERTVALIGRGTSG